MNMIEVDPALFIKCRLCLDETGQYQIVPEIKMQIKYCFDIEVDQFDGLPQLVCKECYSVLKQFTGTKQIFQEKQKKLKPQTGSKIKIDNISPQQQDTVSSTETEIENKNIIKVTKRNKRTPSRNTRSSTETDLSNFSQNKNTKTILERKPKEDWENAYDKYFVCRFCAFSCRNETAIYKHIYKRCKLHKKYSKQSRSCVVSMNKIGVEQNLTNSVANVVYNQNKIIQCTKSSYYIIYKNNSYHSDDSLSDSSDEDFITDKKKRKRQRLVSRSSTDTVILDHDTRKPDEVRNPENNKNSQIGSDNDCVDINDSDSNSTKSSVKTKDIVSELPQTIINRIVTTCSNRYMNRMYVTDGSNVNRDKEESTLKRKILSIGSKVIGGRGVVTTGLLRYMEHKNLEVVWVPKVNNRVAIKTRSKETGDSEREKSGWENITSHMNEDFYHIYEKQMKMDARINKDSDVKTKINKLKLKSPDILSGQKTGKSPVMYIENSDVGASSKNKTNSDTFERKGDNSCLRAVLESDKNWTKLLNANPVANPKQLPKKVSANELSSLAKLYPNEPNDSEVVEPTNMEQSNESLHMPIITSTVSLAQPANIAEQPSVDNSQYCNEVNNVNSEPQSTLPKIKVKPVSELMPNGAPSQQNAAFVRTTGWPVNNENQCQNVMLNTNNNGLYYLPNPSFSNAAPAQQDVVYYPKMQEIPQMQITQFNSTPVNQLGSKPKKLEYVILHTVQLPNTRTESPYRYFQQLLQMHNICLLDSINELSTTMICLTKFKVVFEQDSNSPVKLCLLLFCENNAFCIKAKDHLLTDLDVAKFSANWQWEILKVFKADDIVPKLLTSAMKYGAATYNITNYFTNLLRSIVFSKDS